MDKFKVGDRVRVIKVDYGDPYEVGDQGVVVTNPDDFGLLDVRFIEGYLEYAYPRQLELVWRSVTKSRNWWETSEGIEWLSEQQDVGEQFLKSQEKEEEKTYRFGQRFLVSFKDTTWICILAQVEFNTVCLIGLDEGNRINDPVKVGHSKNITESEMKRIAGNSILQLL